MISKIISLVEKLLVGVAYIFGYRQGRKTERLEFEKGLFDKEKKEIKRREEIHKEIRNKWDGIRDDINGVPGKVNNSKTPTE